MNTLTFEEAKTLLSKCKKESLKDAAFGDMEVTWINPSLSEDDPGYIVANGYFSGTSDSIDIGKQTFTDKEAYELLGCCLSEESTRNDSTGPEEFRLGVTMPGLTREGVYKELTGQDMPK